VEYCKVECRWMAKSISIPANTAYTKPGINCQHYTPQDWHRQPTLHTPRLASTARAKLVCDKMVVMLMREPHLR
jgi:hypothetical protein